jgi:glycosyltransferase involved in cell wall biosynthesis
MVIENYVLITAARNEVSYIETTLCAVTCQELLPKKWLIVSDRSTDRTDEIVTSYALRFTFIELLRVEDNQQWSFSSKVNALRLAYENLKSIDYEFLGILDADISFGPDYFERLIACFQQNERLGIGGGVIWELQGDKFQRLSYNLDSVAGAVQFFRRQCYIDIGGYIELRKGGIDAVAEIMARMHGWQVRSLPELEVHHHRRIGMTNSTLLRSRFDAGIQENWIGSHPLFVVSKCVHRFLEKPYFLGGLLTMAGYFWSLAVGDVRPVPVEVVQYVRNEQKQRMYSMFSRGAKGRE